MVSHRWTKWLVLLVHILWASNIVAALPPPTYVYHVSGRQLGNINVGGLIAQFKRKAKGGEMNPKEWSDYVITSERNKSKHILYAPLGYQEMRQALRAWAEPTSSGNQWRNHKDPILYAMHPGPSTVNGPQDGSFYQPRGWPADQIGWFSVLPNIGGRSPSQQAIHDMSDEALDKYIGEMIWHPHNGHCHLAVTRATRPLLRDNNPEDQQRIIDEIVNTAAEAHLCGNTDKPNPGPPPTGDQATDPGPSTRADCERKSAEIVKELTPDSDPARWEEVAWQLVNVCDPSQGKEPVPGPSGLQQRCQESVAKKLQPVIEKSKAQKRPVPEVIAEAQQAICSPSSSDQASEPPPKKGKDAAELCNRDVSNVLGIFADDEAARKEEILQFLLSSHDTTRDLCRAPGVYESISDFPWEILDDLGQDEALDDQGQEEAALPAEPEQQQPGQEQQQQQDEQDEQRGVQQWPYFLTQVWQRFHIDERSLVAYLDRNDGLSTLQQEYAPVYNLLQQSFPSLLGVLRQVAEAGFTFSSCLPGPPSAPKARANQDQKDELCAKVRAAIGESAQAPGNPKENDKTPSTSPSTPPDHAAPPSPQDNTAPEVLKFLTALGIPLAGAGLGAFAASSAGEALLASTAASLGIGAGVGAAEGVQAALSTLISSLTRTVGQVVQRVLTRVVRLGHRVSNPLLRQMTNSAVRAAAQRAAETIPLLP